MGDIAKLFVTLIAGFLSGVLLLYFAQPDVVYDDFATRTVVAPKVTAQMQKVLMRRMLDQVSAMAKSQTAAKMNKYMQEGQNAKAADQFQEWGKSVTKDLLAPDKLFPDGYYRVHIVNRGRSCAKNLRLVLRVPGVVVDSRVSAAGRPNVRASLIKAVDDTIPVGLQISDRQLPTLAPGEELTLQAWYAQGTPNPDLLPDWPAQPELWIFHDAGIGRRVSSPAGEEAASGMTMLVPLIIGALLLIIAGTVLSSWAIRLSRRTRMR